MWISNFAIRNPVITVAVMLALAVFGIFSLLTLDTDEFPEVNPPVVTVAIPYPGASPEIAEREVVERLEEAFSSISGIDKIRSTAMDGFVLISLEFLFEKNLQEASQDARDRISEVRRDLPREMEEPVLTRFDPNDLPIVSLTLSSPDLSPTALSRLADPEITGALRAVNGVADVTLVGGIERELTVELDPDALAANNVAITQVVQALVAQNQAAPVGRVTGAYDERTIRLSGRLESPAEFERLAIVTAGGRTVELGDVAVVRDGGEEPRTMALADGVPAVGINIKKSRGFSTTTVSQGVSERVREIQRTLPEGVALRAVQDSGVRVAQSVEDVVRSLVEGAVLTVLVVLIFLTSWRSTVITGLALPISVLAAFIAVKALGFTLNTMSLLGLSLSIGILIDDAIVVRENIVRHMEMRKDHVTAAREGTGEIGLAVAATTLSIVVVFVPVAFMGGIAEQWFAPLALTIAASVLVSLFVSFSLDPMLSAIWPDPEVEGGKRTWLSRRLVRFSDWLGRCTRGYQRVVGWALDHRWIVALVAIGTLAVAMAMPALGLIGVEFFPRQDRSEFRIKLESPPGSNIEYTRRKATEAIRMAKALPEVDYTYTTIGGQSGSGAVDEAMIYVRLSPKAERDRHQDTIAEALRGDVRRVAGVTASLVTGGFTGEKQLQLQLTGPELLTLNAVAERIASEVTRVPGAVDVGLSSKGQKPELDVRLDRALAANLGISAIQIAESLRPAFAGLDAGTWIDPAGEPRDVTVRLAPQARTSAWHVATLPLLFGGDAGPRRLVPLGQIAEIRRTLGPTQISHLDRERVVTVGLNPENVPMNQVVQGIEARLAAVPIPPGYRVSQGGDTERQEDVFRRIMRSLLLAVMLMYLVLVVQFRSFLEPIPILASLPLSLIGVMLALFFTGSTLNLMSLIGLILLMGIVAKNAILLIDFAKWAEESGMDRKAAIIEAGGIRLRPILMTSLAIIAGMIPVALGSGEGGDFRAPLGRAVIGGVVTSTLLTLLVIPPFYDALAGARDWLRRRLSRRG